MKDLSAFGDLRLDSRQNELIDAMISRQSIVLNQLSDSRKDLVAFHRFLNNKKVNTESVLNSFSIHNTPDFAGKNLLMIQDTSDLCFGFNENRGHLGYIGRNTEKTGFALHPCLTIDADDGGCYGLAALEIHYTDYQKTIERQQAGLPKPINKAPFKEKQSYRWFSCAEKAIANTTQAASQTIVADQESDIYEAIVRFDECDWDYLIRSTGKRNIESTDAQVELLSKQVQRWAVEFSYSVDLPKTDKRTAHRAKLMVKFNKTTLLQPKSRPDKKVSDKVEVYVIHVQEHPDTVVNKEKPIDWTLITSHPIENQQQALYWIQCYCWRWIIEQVFRVLKSKGLKLEESQLEQPQAVENQAVLALIAATQVLQLVQAREGQTKQKITDVFTDDEIKCLEKLNKKLEGKTEKQKNPHQPNSIAFAIWVIARLGGWKGYKGKARPPGPITIKNGLVRFYNNMEGYYLLL